MRLKGLIAPMTFATAAIYISLFGNAAAHGQGYGTVNDPPTVTGTTSGMNSEITTTTYSYPDSGWVVHTITCTAFEPQMIMGHTFYIEKDISVDDEANGVISPAPSNVVFLPRLRRRY